MTPHPNQPPESEITMATLLMSSEFQVDVFQLETANPRTVGEATVWDVVKVRDVPTWIADGVMTLVTESRVVGKIVLRDGIMFARDVTACGAPLILDPETYGLRLVSMLSAASAVLFA